MRGCGHSRALPNGSIYLAKALRCESAVRSAPSPSEPSTANLRSTKWRGEALHKSILFAEIERDNLAPPLS